MARPRWQEDEVVQAWSALLRAHASALRLIEEDLQRAGGMPLSWYDVLLELNAAVDGPLRMQDLGKRAVLSRTRVSRVVDDLEGAGLAVRTADPVDGRCVLASITAAGRGALRRAAPGYLAAVRRHFAGRLTTDQVRAVRDAMEVVLADPR